MSSRRSRASPSGGLRGFGAAAAIALSAALGAAGCHGSSGDAALEALLHWNRISIDASGFDHTPAGGAEQVGPGRASKAMAVVHIAMFEAVNAIAGGHESYVALPAAPSGASMRAAIAQAAHDALVHLFPSQAASFDDELARSLDAIPDGPSEADGIDVGSAAAAAIVAMREFDGSLHAEPLVNVDFLPSDAAGSWRQDPVSMHPLALGARWAEVAPFVLASASQFRAPPPPPISSPEYAIAYEEVKRLGGDGIVTPTERTADQTHAGIFWAYDGTPSLCAPPRLYNQIAVRIAGLMSSDVVETARLLALVNVAMADAGIAIWESKYFYRYWRPVTGIRESDPGTGPTGTGDGNAATVGDPGWTPLGAPASNLAGPNFTPPFPAYPSGHAGFGGAVFETLRRFYGTDDIAFTFVSDEFNGVTRDHDGNVRPLLPRSFSSLSEAEQENGQSRIYLGIHWSFDRTEGIALGRSVANHVFDSVFTPLP
jgi:hypothetical protein